MRKQTLWITRTAVFIALLIGAQAATAPLNNTLVTGSLVNLILAVSVMICGLPSGLTVAALSPVIAKFFGIGPKFWTLIPFILLGNVVLVLIWSLIGKKTLGASVVTYSIAAVCAAVAKFATLYFGVVQIAVPMLLKLPEVQAGVISAMFSVPQLITALIGGGVAAIILPVLRKAVKSEN